MELASRRVWEKETLPRPEEDLETRTTNSWNFQGMLSLKRSCGQDSSKVAGHFVYGSRIARKEKERRSLPLQDIKRILGLASLRSGLGYYAGIQALIGTTNLEQIYESVKLFMGNYCAIVLIKETKPDLTPPLQSLKLSSVPRIQMNPEFDHKDCQKLWNVPVAHMLETISNPLLLLFPPLLTRMSSKKWKQIRKGCIEEDRTPDSGIQTGNVRFLKREDNIEDADQTEELRLMIYAGRLYILVEERTEIASWEILILR
ncbi:hypothetical protein NC651_033937 [Populus alba x Populus x berolinensis]|nr:hypothetical protein NC651_033937 [Populus alba x Populus x berolinensis]